MDHRIKRKCAKFARKNGEWNVWVHRSYLCVGLNSLLPIPLFTSDKKLVKFSPLPLNSRQVQATNKACFVWHTDWISPALCKYCPDGTATKVTMCTRLQSCSVSGMLAHQILTYVAGRSRFSVPVSRGPCSTHCQFLSLPGRIVLHWQPSNRAGNQVVNWRKMPRKWDQHDHDSSAKC